MTKTRFCTNCKEEKPKSEFNKQKQGLGGFSAQCKVCKARYDRQRVRRETTWKRDNPKKVKEINKRACLKREKNRTQIKHWLIDNYAGVPCLDCDTSYSWCVMDFDHTDQEAKEFEICKLSSYKATPERITQAEKEIAKCDLVCANCHRIRTYITRNQNAKPQR